MFRRVLTWLVAGASAALALLTLAGLMAPLDPRFEMINHFRPVFLVAAAGTFLFSLLMRRRALAVASALPLFLIASLTLAPLYFAAPSADGQKPNLRVVSMNLWVENRNLLATALLLRATNADVIVVQEVLCAPSDPLFAALRASYPHQFRSSERCFGQAILSKHPITLSGTENYRHRQPVWMWADVSLGAQTVRVTSVHLSHPTQPFDQVTNIDALAAYARNVQGPHIMAGDFNLTPHSWLLTKFALNSGMRRSGTFQASWPGHRALPVFLIDHVFVNEHFLRADFRVAPFAGSDHRPVIADLVLRKSAIASLNPARF